MKTYTQLMEDLRAAPIAEETPIGEQTVHLAPHGNKGTHFKVVKGIKGQLENGEVIHDSAVDDLHDVGIKTKILKEDELTEEEMGILVAEDVTDFPFDDGEQLVYEKEGEFFDHHFKRQTPKVQSQLNNHMRLGRSYREAISKTSGATPLNEDEQINELSQSKVRAYRDKARDDKENMEDDEQFYRAHGDNTHHEKNEIRKRSSGIKVANSKIIGAAKVPMRESAPDFNAPERTEAEEKKIARGQIHGDYKGHQSAMCKKHGIDFYRDGPAERKLARGQVREEEQIEELSKASLTSYADKSLASYKKTNVSGETTKDSQRRFQKRSDGLNLAASKIRSFSRAKTPVREDEQIEELSTMTMGRYAYKALGSPNKSAKRSANIEKATRKIGLSNQAAYEKGEKTEFWKDHEAKQKLAKK